MRALHISDFHFQNIEKDENRIQKIVEGIINYDSSILGLFKNFTPMIVQNFLFEAMAQENLQNIFEKK